MDDLRKLCLQRCLFGRLVKRRMKWSGHEERKDEDQKKARKTTLGMVRLHQGWSWSMMIGGQCPRVEDSEGMSSTGRWNDSHTRSWITDTRRRERENSSRCSRIGQNDWKVHQEEAVLENKPRMQE